MKMLFIILACCLALNAGAQLRKSGLETWKQVQKDKNIKAIIDSSNKTGAIQFILPLQSQMPNSFTAKLALPKKIGNNGKGFDVYVLPVDNMLLLKPDSTFVSRIPNVSFKF